MKSRIRRAVELKMMVKLVEWRPKKWVTRATKTKDEAMCKREKFKKHSVILQSDYCNVMRSLL